MDATQETSPPVESASVPQELWSVARVAAFLQIARVPASHQTIYRKVATGEFPQPVRFGNRCTRWRAGDVHAWLKAHTAGPIVGAAEGVGL